MHDVIGIDFGTTNSVIALRQADGQVASIRYAAGQGVVDTFRSVLCFWAEESGANRGRLEHAAGPNAIEAYLDDPLGSRLIMSMKSYLASRSFVETRVFNRPFALEDLISTFLRSLVAGAVGAPSLGSARVIAGRPVRFVGDNADDSLAERRLRNAFNGAGYAFDFRIIDNVVSPKLGKGGTYKVMDTALPVPPAFFTSFARWHQLSLMRAPRTLREINEVARLAAEPERLRHLIRLVEDEVGYALYQSVSAAKAGLSKADSAVLSFAHRDFSVEERIERADFERWIGPELAQLSSAIDRALTDAKLAPGQVDRVFLTGGTSLVPAVRRLFDDRFGAERVTGGGEFVSVAEGLALIGAAA
jgi:hypothetical chaperone protein